MNINRRVVPTLTAAALLAGSAVALSSFTATGSAEDEGTTLTFTLAPRSATFKYVDLGRKGPSIGDRHLTAISIKSDGQVAGRVLIECVATDARYEGQTCDLAAQLADGTLFFEGMGFHKPVPNVGAGDDTLYAITGGAGAYAGAEGEVTIGLDDDGPVTITLFR